jgi:hypothetical protein
MEGADEEPEKPPDQLINFVWHRRRAAGSSQ